MEEELPPFLVPPPGVQKNVDKLLGPLVGKRLVAIGVGSKMPAERWFLDRYIEVVRRILAYDYQIALVFFGAQEEMAECERVRSTVDQNRTVNLSGQTNIIESAEAISRCAFYVGNDTGTMHLAAIMGCPCVAIFSARANPGRWEPFGESNLIYRKDVPCDGCMLEECIEMKMKCLDLISVDEVWEGVRTLLDHANTTVQ